MPVNQTGTPFRGACWRFELFNPRYVESEPTQRDLFNGDDLELTEALVREVVQNSLDAKTPGSPRVQVFFTLDEISGERASRFRQTLSGLDRHLEACSLPTTPAEDPIRVLVIEDFGTRGLTGAVDAADEQNFHNFWRRLGGSNKIGDANGRWGLGKLVFSSSSDIQTIFGYTVRNGDQHGVLFGQSVLSGHRLDDKRYMPHGFWFTDTGPDDIQLPLEDASSIEEFLSIHKIRRRSPQTGLSLVIPFIKSPVTESDIIAAAVRNYYFPILAGQLEIVVGDIHITEANFTDIATRYLGDTIPINFIRGISARRNAEPTATAKSTLDTSPVTQDSFTPEDLERVRKRFDAHEVVHIRLPVRMTPMKGVPIESFVDLFLAKFFPGDSPFSIFVRGSLTVPSEAKRFQGSLVKAALVASDDGACSFLGDAENPAHTALSNKANKLLTRWVAPGNTIKHIRSALKDMYGLLVENNTRRDREALLDFFFLPLETRTTTEKHQTIKQDVPEIERREEPFEIVGCEGGFRIVPNADPTITNLAGWPRKLHVRIAYEVITGEALRLHTEDDFKLNEDGVTVSGDKNVRISFNELDKASFVATITRGQFEIRGTGFDPKRDLVVSANLISDPALEAAS